MSRAAERVSGEDAVITKVTWTGGRTPTGEDSLFQFLAQPASARTYTFQVEQTYSDGSIVNWSGPESSEAPAPTIRAKRRCGGGGVSVLTIIALVIGALGLLAGGFALVEPRSREDVPWHEADAVVAVVLAAWRRAGAAGAAPPLTPT